VVRVVADNYSREKWKANKKPSAYFLEGAGRDLDRRKRRGEMGLDAY